MKFDSIYRVDVEVAEESLLVKYDNTLHRVKLILSDISLFKSNKDLKSALIVQFYF